jgi:predicted metal-dependent hydrolase
LNHSGRQSFQLLSASVILTEGVVLFNQQAFFECHEVLEDLWRPLPMGAEKQFLQGLIQIAVGFHHHQKRNQVGAKSLLTSGLEKLRQNEPPKYASHYDWIGVIAATQSILETLLTNEKSQSNPVIDTHSFPYIAAS